MEVMDARCCTQLRAAVNTISSICFLLVMLTTVANCEIEGKLNSKSELSSLPPFSCSMIDVAMKIDSYQLTKALDQLAQAR